MKTCRSGIVFFGYGLARTGMGHRNVEALLRLVTDLNEHTCFYARRMRVPGDVTGADSVLCWQTGYPFSVHLGRGYPRYNPGEFSGPDMLARGEIDACLFVGGEGMHYFTAAARKHLESIPTILLDAPTAAPPFEPTVRLTTSVHGIHLPGTAYRMDEVPIRLRAVLPAKYQSDADALTAIAARL
jgi:formylmethanofuran dehydrogenase subunit B